MTCYDINTSLANQSEAGLGTRALHAFNKKGADPFSTAQDVNSDLMMPETVEKASGLNSHLRTILLYNLLVKNDLVSNFKETTVLLVSFCLGNFDLYYLFNDLKIKFSHSSNLGLGILISRTTRA